MPISVEHNAVAEMLGPFAESEVLLVHSAFAGLSRAGFRAETFCDALVAAMPAGTLLMPTMTWRSVTPANPIFDELATPSHTGVLTEIFRRRCASHRSLHPTHSVAGLGPLAAYLLSSHHLGETPCPAASPYGLVRDVDAAILLLGVGLDSCTAIHHAEETIAPDFYVRPPDEAESYTLHARDGTEHCVRTRRHRRLPRDFPQFEPALRAGRKFRAGAVAGVSWQLFALGDLYRIVLQALTHRPDATLEQAG
jgi:aminoglycoside 3-N-acetyltransferase